MFLRSFSYGRRLDALPEQAKSDPSVTLALKALQTIDSPSVGPLLLCKVKAARIVSMSARIPRTNVAKTDRSLDTAHTRYMPSSPTALRAVRPGTRGPGHDNLRRQAVFLSRQLAQDLLGLAQDLLGGGRQR